MPKDASGQEIRQKQSAWVDELGGIEKAIKIAADLANLDDDYVVYEYPRKRSLIRRTFLQEQKRLGIKNAQRIFGR